MKFILSYCLTFLVYTNIEAQISGGIISRDTLVRCVMDLRKDTTIINSKGAVINTSISGTGLFVLNEQDAYIVTAAHVAKSMDFSSYIIMGGSNDIPKKIYLLDLI
ncbi:hypothetical protein [Mucilaginibacter sp. NFX135]|uniref:hypothetical protein n=1 Tax=Mucilaginibacter sp. NFX135 TaxID=3402687 RepID=UPI003AFA06ED